MTQELGEYYRYCPDQPEVRISDSVCLSRQRANYHLCAGCPFNKDKENGRDAPPTTDERGTESRFRWDT